MEYDSKHNFDEVLKNVLKKLKSPDDAMYIDSFTKFLNAFIVKLKETDPLLRTYGKIVYSGSFANNIRVGKQDEFDINVCLKLPAELYDNLNILNSAQAGYIQLQTTGLDSLKKHQNWETYKSVGKWIDEKGFLQTNKFRDWMESIMTKTLNKLVKNSGRHVLDCTDESYFISFKKSGPALTLKVTSDRGLEFDVDLVSSFHFKFPAWPPNVKQKFSQQFESDEWYAIAKPLYKKNTDLCWRPVFPLQEIEILTRHNNMKSVIRLIKQLRDNNEMTYVASYFINMLFIWEVKTQDKFFWNQSLSFLFIHMISKFNESILERQIPSYWVNNLNLLDKLSQHQLQACEDRIRGIIRKIKKNYKTNPEKLEDIFLGNVSETSMDDTDPSDDDTDPSDDDTPNMSQSLEQSIGLAGGIGLFVGAAALVGGIALLSAYMNRPRTNQR